MFVKVRYIFEWIVSQTTFKKGTESSVQTTHSGHLFRPTSSHKWRRLWKWKQHHIIEPTYCSKLIRLNFPPSHWFKWAVTISQMSCRYKMCDFKKTDWFSACSGMWVKKKHIIKRKSVTSVLKTKLTWINAHLVLILFVVNFFTLVCFSPHRFRKLEHFLCLIKPKKESKALTNTTTFALNRNKYWHLIGSFFFVKATHGCKAATFCTLYENINLSGSCSNSNETAWSSTVE